MGREPRTELCKLLFGQRVYARGRCFELNLVSTHRCEVELVPGDDLGQPPAARRHLDQGDAASGAAPMSTPTTRSSRSRHTSSMSATRVSRRPPSSKICVSRTSRASRSSSPASSSSIGSAVITTSSANEATADHGTRRRLRRPTRTRSATTCGSVSPSTTIRSSTFPILVPSARRTARASWSVNTTRP